MDYLFALATDPVAWAGLATLVTLEIILGIDNLIFISIITDKLPPAQQPAARRTGIGLALVMRLILLAAISWIIGLNEVVFDLGIEGKAGIHGEPTFETAFSWRDIILVAGGAFLVWKATTEIHHKVDRREDPDVPGHARRIQSGFALVIAQIVLIDIVFSVDSILTAIGMTDDLPIMYAAVTIAVLVMFFAANPVANFVNTNPSVIMLALAFLLMIGMVLIADGFGRHVPKGYIYTAMAFAVFVETLNMLARKNRSARVLK